VRHYRRRIFITGNSLTGNSVSAVSIEFDAHTVDRFLRKHKSNLTPHLINKLRALFNFFHDNSDLARVPDGKQVPVGSDQHLMQLMDRFIRGRENPEISTSATVSDPIVENILLDYFGVDEEQEEEAVNWHRNAMAAENIIGSLLEAYIAANLEPHGWIWCAGEVARSIDFIYPAKNQSWIALQIKNRSNTENSSSNKVRQGTTIEKWYRLNAKNGTTYWSKLKTTAGVENLNLSDEGFADFVRRSLGDY